MFEIRGIPPHQKVQMLITTRSTAVAAKAFAANLAKFGYTDIRVEQPVAQAPASVA